VKKLFLLPLLLIPLCSFAPAYNHSFDYKTEFKKEKERSAKKEYIETLIKTFSYQESRGNHKLTGSSGEVGEFQIMPATWKGFCKIYTKRWVQPTQKAQKEMLYVVLTDWVDKGLTLEQIAAKWNSGSHFGWKNKIGVNVYGVPYSVPAYVKKFVKTFNKLKNKQL
jgi:hypothetical protein